jgi:hypothetical protein
MADDRKIAKPALLLLLGMLALSTEWLRPSLVESLSEMLRAHRALPGRK